MVRDVHLVIFLDFGIIQRLPVNHVLLDRIMILKIKYVRNVVLVLLLILTKIHVFGMEVLMVLMEHQPQHPAPPVLQPHPAQEHQQQLLVNLALQTQIT